MTQIERLDAIIAKAEKFSEAVRFQKVETQKSVEEIYRLKLQIDQYQAQIASLNNENLLRLSQIENLQSEKAEYQNHNTATRVRYDHEIAVLKDQLATVGEDVQANAALRVEIAALRQQVTQQASHYRERNEAQTKVSELTAAIEAQQAAIIAQDSLVSEIAQLKEQVDNQRAHYYHRNEAALKVKSLEKALSEAMKNIADKEQQLALKPTAVAPTLFETTLSDDYKILQSEMKRLQQQVENQSQTIVDLNNRIKNTKFAHPIQPARDMTGIKNKINEYIQVIDHSIALLHD